MSSRTIKKHGKKDYREAVEMMAHDIRELTRIAHMAAVLLKSLGHEKEANRVMFALTGKEEFNDSGDGGGHREPGPWQELEG